MSLHRHRGNVQVRYLWCVFVNDFSHFYLVALCARLFNNSVADPNPGSDAFLTPGSGIGKKWGSGSRINNPVHISESLETIIWVKILRLFDANRVPGWKKFGSWMEKIRIRDEKKFGSGINHGSATLFKRYHTYVINMLFLQGLSDCWRWRSGTGWMEMMCWTMWRMPELTTQTISWLSSHRSVVCQSFQLRPSAGSPHTGL